MIKKVSIVLLIILAIIKPVDCWSDTLSEPIEKETRYLPLSLKKCLILTLKHNLILADLRLSPQISYEQIIQAESIFDPQVSADLNHLDSKTPRVSSLFGNVFEEQQTRGNVGISKQFPLGTQTGLSISNFRSDDSSPFRVLDPSYDSSLALTITQPLLKNFGWEVNQTNISIALNNRKISTLSLKASILDQLNKTIRLYWDLFFAYQNKKVQEVLLKQAQSLLEMNQAKVEIGVLAPIVITEAQAGVASRKEAIILAQIQIRDLVDQILAQTNLSSQSWDLLIMPIDKPADTQLDISLKERLNTAFKQRPDYLSVLVSLKNQKTQISFQANQKEPDMNLSGSFGYSGLSDDLGESWSNLSKLNYPTWKVGVNFSYPLGNRKSSSLYIQRRLEKQQTEIKIQQLKQLIFLEVRKAYRELTAGWERIQANIIARDLEKEKSRIEEEKLKLGRSTNQRVLDFQSDLAQAKINYLKAVLDYNKSLAELDRASGILLTKYGIDINEPIQGVKISRAEKTESENKTDKVMKTQ